MRLLIGTHLMLVYPDDGGVVYVLKSGFTFPQQYLIIMEDPHEGAEFKTVFLEKVLELGFTKEQLDTI